MTTKETTLTQEASQPERFPEFPPRDDMQNTNHLHLRSVLTSLEIYFAPRPNTLVHSEMPVSPTLGMQQGVRIPDLMVVLDCDIEDAYRIDGYAIDRQGKPPDFVLEVASKTTGVVDYTAKRADYERFAIGEYWRFDPTGGDFHDASLAADRLVEGVFQPIEIEMAEDDVLRGYSEALGLYVCWDNGKLRFYDPESQCYLLTHQEVVELADEARVRADDEAAARRQAEAEVRRLRERLEGLGEID